MHICIYICMYIPIFIYVNTCICICVCTYIHICIYTYTYINTNIYIHTQIHTHTYLYTYMHIHERTWMPSKVVPSALAARSTSYISTIPTPRDRATSSCVTLFISRHFLNMTLDESRYYDQHRASQPSLHLETEQLEHTWLYRSRAISLEWRFRFHAISYDSRCHDTMINMVHPHT